MKSIQALLLFVCMSFMASAQLSSERSYHARLYDILNNGEEQQIEVLLNTLNDFPAKDTLAYSGALKMKLAGKLGSPLQKLSMFKEGRKELEYAIGKDSLNAEYRFLRLIIQENAPGILGYDHNMDEDKMFILQKFPKQNGFIKAEIRKYASSSKVLTLSSLNE